MKRALPTALAGIATLAVFAFAHPPISWWMVPAAFFGGVVFGAAYAVVFDRD